MRAGMLKERSGSERPNDGRPVRAQLTCLGLGHSESLPPVRPSRARAGTMPPENWILDYRALDKRGKQVRPVYAFISTRSMLPATDRTSGCLPDGTGQRNGTGMAGADANFARTGTYSDLRHSSRNRPGRRRSAGSGGRLIYWRRPSPRARRFPAPGTFLVVALGRGRVGLGMAFRSMLRPAHRAVAGRCAD